MWIYLGQAHYGKSGGEKFKPALTALRAAIATGQIVCPFSAITVMETMTRKDSGSRERLAKFVVELSANRALLPRFILEVHEINQAVFRRFSGPTKISLREQVIVDGTTRAFGMNPVVEGVPPDLAAVLRAEYFSPETSEMFMAKGIDAETAAKLRAEDEAAASELDSIRKRARADLKDDDLIERVNWADMFFNGPPGKELKAALAKMLVNPEKFSTSFKKAEDYVEFFRDIPTLDVFITIGLARDRQVGRVIEPNDLRDLDALSVAIPYANAVCTEHFCRHLAVQEKLDARYDTVVFSDLTKLPEVLQDIGTT